jgi:2-oxoglutarate dehydrogenase E2 component (dihydrolipoamide succinyltransferase)
MATVDLVMPKMGESIMEATILKWLKQPGDAVQQDETVLEIATDKVDTEVPSTTEGVITEILFKENDVVPVGTVIARIKTEVEENTTAPQFQPLNQESRMHDSGYSIHDKSHKMEDEKTQTSTATTTFKASPVESSGRSQNTNGIGNRFYSPLVLNIASSEGVSMSELEKIHGSGNEGRVTKKDILQFVSDRRSGKSPGSQSSADSQYPAFAETEELEERNLQTRSPAMTHQLPTVYTGNVEIIEMDRMRKLIADHMVRSKHTSAHVTSFTEADVTNLVLWRDKVKKEFEKREGTKITFTHLFVEAIVKCIKKFPLINSSVDGDKIIIKKDINIGIATALPSGNLIVPIIKNADQLNLVGLAKQVNSLAENARSGKLRPDDTQGGTFTLTNVGSFGSLMGTPIINQPQVAILAVGAIKKRPVVVETPLGDSIAIRHMMYLSMSYDHRIVDGSLGATFLTSVANELENFSGDREF